MRALMAHVGKYIVVEGECEGADVIARNVALNTLDLAVMPFPAPWTRYGKAAGPIRNGQMLKDGLADAVIAFHADIAKSRGTADMVAQARKAGRPVWICTDGPEALFHFIVTLEELLKTKQI